jgi:hypothetical protein
MLVAAIVVGAITAWYWGLRKGAWAAGLTAGACAVALFVPRLALPIYVGLSIAVVLVCLTGAKRARPTDTVMAVRWLKYTVGKTIERVRGKQDDRR